MFYCGGALVGGNQVQGRRDSALTCTSGHGIYKFYALTLRNCNGTHRMAGLMRRRIDNGLVDGAWAIRGLSLVLVSSHTRRVNMRPRMTTAFGGQRKIALGRH